MMFAGSIDGTNFARRAGRENHVIRLITVSSGFFLHPSEHHQRFSFTRRAYAMAEIHDQFDTILILDFGSQVRLLAKDRDAIVEWRNAV